MNDFVMENDVPEKYKGDQMIRQATESMRRHFARNIPLWWDEFFTRSPEYENGFELFGPSSYAFKLGTARFLVDPCFRDPSWGEPLAERITADLEKLDGILLTHGHGDHCDPSFIRLASAAKVRWFVPDFFCFEELYRWGLSPEQITPVSAGDCISFGGVSIRFFESNHRNEGASSFVREYGFCMTCAGKNYIFPGDVRDYDPAFYPTLPDADILFAHLWLGREQALCPPWEPKLTEFCEFLLSFRPKCVTLAHLYEVGRPPEDLWTWQHAGAVQDRMLALSPQTAVFAPKPGVWYAFDHLSNI